MKKIFKIFTVLLFALLVSGALVSCKNGEDGDDGTSIDQLVLKQTGNIWYEYTNTADTTTTPTAVTSDNNVSLADIYLKYDTTNKSLIMAAVGTSYYATTSKSMDSDKWAASAVTLRVMGKITKSSTDPTSGKTKLSDFNSWGDFTVEHLIETLFE
ncbi:MAG: hypothetical protein II821_00570 [Treponema sp.]|nr:hypothetical protein [Treponema sp.]